MKKTAKIFSLLLALLMMLSAFTACNNDKKGDEVSTTASTTVASTTAKKEESGEPDVDSEKITVTATKASQGVTGNIDGAFAPESNGENVIEGAEQQPTTHVIYASLPSPTVITSLILKAPTENQDRLASATIDGSVDGKTWVTIKNLGSTITAGKTYNLNVGDETAYLYIRVKQTDEERTKSFRFRNVEIMGIPSDGQGGDINVVEAENTNFPLIPMTSYLASSVDSGEPKDVFLDNDKSFTTKSASVDAPNFLIATMQKKTEIRSITVKVFGDNIRSRGTEVMVSCDGKEWKTLYIIPDVRQTEGVKEFTFYVNDTEKYSFIKLLQKADLGSYAWTVDKVLINGIPSEEDANSLPRKYIDATTVNATYYDSHIVKHNEVTPDNVFDLTNKESQFTHAGQGGKITKYEKFYVGAKLENPTIITQIIYYAPPEWGKRASSSYFEASVDGKDDWVKVGTLPYGDAYYQNHAVITLTVDDDTAYNYIRIVQFPEWYESYWTLGTVEIKGVKGE